jgi:acyl-CoA dehydrogenase
MLADSEIELSAARLMVMHAAWRIEAGLAARDNIAMVKVNAAATLGHIADRAVQLFGGSGYARGGLVERCYHDARILRIDHGTSKIHRGYIARSLLRNGADFTRI